MKDLNQQNYYNILILKKYMKQKQNNYKKIFNKLFKNKTNNYKIKYAINFKSYQTKFKKSYKNKNKKN